MTAALILTSASHTIACASCNAPWPRESAQCPGCGLRDPAASSALRACERCGAWDGPEHVAEECDGILANRSLPSYDALRAQLAAVTAERDALHAAVRTLADAQLACDAADDATGSARDAARLRHDHASIALYALVPAAPAHNPGARVVATGGGR